MREAMVDVGLLGQREILFQPFRERTLTARLQRYAASGMLPSTSVCPQGIQRVL